MGWLEEHQTNECVENLQVVIDRLRGEYNGKLYSPISS